MPACLPGLMQSQAKIAQIIQQEAIDQNYTMAMEEAPDMFARIMMLYIDTEVVAARQSDVEACLTVPHLVIYFFLPLP